MTGTVLPFAGAASPTGWLLCYGQAVSRVTYAALFAVIGTTYGAGDGSTTFNVPDLRGRVAAGMDNMGGTAANRLTNSGTGNPGVNGATLGATGGADRHTLGAAEMPSHTHSDYYQSGALSYTPVLVEFQNATSGVNVVADVRPAFWPGPSITNTGASTTTGAAGSGVAHPNAQPTIVLNSIIKT